MLLSSFKRINTCKNFSRSFIDPGTENVSKDSVSKHIASDQHKQATRLKLKRELGNENYQEKVVLASPIAKRFVKLSEEDRAGIRVKMNTIYYLLKNERPYSDYPKLLELQQKNNVPELLKKQIRSAYATSEAGAVFGDFIGKFQVEELIKDLAKINYYSILTDGSTDNGVVEQEAIYILFLVDGVPKLRYFSIESVKNGNAQGVYESIKTAFERVGILNFEDRIVGLNADGASVNMGQFSGLGKLIKDKAFWLELVHCFSHRIELALKDAFDTSPFGKIDNMLMKLYYLYQKSPKRYRELKELGEIYEKTIPKPTKANGTRWIDHKYRAMKKVLDNYGAYMTHLESLSHTDSQVHKRSEMQGNVQFM